jgi:hypothetical protein
MKAFITALIACFAVALTIIGGFLLHPGIGLMVTASWIFCGLVITWLAEMAAREGGEK